MIDLALTPDQFQTVITAWIAVITAITLALVTALAFLAPKIIMVIQQIKDAWVRLNQHHVDIVKNQREIGDIKRELPPTNGGV